LGRQTDRQEGLKEEPMMDERRYTHNSKQKNLSEIK